MGHFEEHREAISANEQVAGREETSPGGVIEPWCKWENKWSWQACGFEVANPWELVEIPKLGRGKRKIKHPLQLAGRGSLRAVATQGTLKTHSVRPGSSGSQGVGGLQNRSAGWAAGEHLYLNSTICSCPGLRLPALGLMENMQLSCMRIWCSSVQSNSAGSAHSSRSICWSFGKRKALGEGYKARGVERLSQNTEAGALSPRGMEGGFLLCLPHFMPPFGKLSHARPSNVAVEDAHFIMTPKLGNRSRALVTKQKTGDPVVDARWWGATCTFWPP